MHTVPFSISDAYEGLAEVGGLARFEADVLTLEFQTQDAFFGLVKSGVQEVPITLPDLVSVHFSKNMFRATIHLRVRSMALFEKIPGANRGEVKLRFARKYRDEAHALASRLQLRLSERRLEQMDDEIRKLDDIQHPDDTGKLGE